MKTLNDVLTPAFGEKNVPIFCSTDDNFAPYCGVMLQSIIDHASPAWNYDLIILHSGLSEKGRKYISSLSDGLQHVSIRFYDVSSFLRGKDFPQNDVYTLATWYRIFAPSIFAEYEKIVYLDVDVVVLADIAELFHEHIGENMLAGCTDLGIVGVSTMRGSRPYFIETIGVTDIMQYVNAGVLLLNIQKMRELGVEKDCIEAALTKHFWNNDQDTLNHICCGHIQLVDPTWNIFPARGFENYLPPEVLSLWKLKKQTPRIIHYIGIKPWDNPFSDMAVHWWQAAAHTPYFDELQRTLLHRLIGHVVHYKRDLRRYRVCRLLSKLTFGKLRKRLTERKRSLRRHLRLIRDIMKGV